ncbi:MAG: hypothetical protein JSV96_09095 [Candidatus Aminicenantes bacterium]|nr:MAG: hypothetical protein JSV96_09095 [Candidatus Aminicenantes bacterium]
MTLEDHLPEGLSYVPFSFMVDGFSKTPTVADHVVSYDFESTGTFEIEFQVLYDSAPTAPLPVTVYNWAYLKSDGCVKADDDARITMDPYCNFHKKGTLLESGDDLVIEKNENAIWTFHIWVRNMYTEAFWGEDVTLYNVVVTDRLAAELEVDDPPAPEYPEGTTLTYPRKGNIKITWTIGTLLPGERVDLYMQISTRMKGKKQQYTSCGTYEWNSGAVLKFNFGAEDGVQLSAHSEKYWVNVPGTWPGTPPPE